MPVAVELDEGEDDGLAEGVDEVAEVVDTVAEVVDEVLHTGGAIEVRTGDSVALVTTVEEGLGESVAIGRPILSQILSTVDAKLEGKWYSPLLTPSQASLKLIISPVWISSKLYPPMESRRCKPRECLCDGL